MLKSRLVSLLFCIAGISFCKTGELEDPPVVDTDLGQIVGSTVTVNGIQIRQFLGIPYAKSPTGDRRFKKPDPVDAWSEPLIATNEPAACVQYTENPFPWYDNETGKSEDCLFLNIWTPSDSGPDNTKAVFYWIFGGGFFIGSIRHPFYSGEALSALGDIIVVTVSYRLGSLGFLYSGSEDAPGNVGLWDILAGLQWVNDHISAFGGDISRITLAGGSAGSIAVGLLSVSPLAENLYTRQIMQSGSPAYTLADDNTASLVRSQKIAELVNCANDAFTLEDNPREVVECLRETDAMELIQAESSLIPHSSRSFLPKYGDDILPELPRQRIIDGDIWNKDLLIGNSKDEGSFQITTSNPEIFGFFGENDPQINKSFGQDMLRRIFAAYPDTESVVQHFLPDSIPEDDFDYVRSQVYTASGDFTLLCPTVYYAEKSAQNGNSVTFYLWSHRSSTLPWATWMNITHYSEIEFLFGLPVKNPENYGENEDVISKDLIYKWSNFVKSGIPMTDWPLYSKENPLFLHLDPDDESETSVGSGPHKENCDFFRSQFGFLIIGK